jgi:hypothetical protein
MDAQSQKDDLLDLLDFIDKLLAFLVGLVPPAHARQYRRVWNTQVRPALLDVKGRVEQITPAEATKLGEVGWDPESARMKTDTIAATANAGSLETTLHLVNSAMGSLKIVFLGLEAPKEFKEFLEVWAKGRPEPESHIQTLFGRGPIPGPAPTNA